MPTHDVTNQPPPFVGVDVYGSDPTLTEAVERWVPGTGRADAHAALHALGEQAGSAEAAELAERAERNAPRLRTHDRWGHRVDEVAYDPAWHDLMRVAVGAGLTAGTWAAGRGTGAHVRRAAGFVTWSQVDAGHICPVTMTHAAVPALRHSPELAARYEPGLASREYDPGLRAPALKAGLVAGMGMTEKQGGSDVRANRTLATPAPDGPLPGRTYRLTGHKWFCSAPMSDLFLVLARTDGQDTPSCFAVPRVLDDETRNPFALQRLKDKLGDRSNASSEVELDGTWGSLVGEEGRGVRTIIDMVAATRLDCVLGSAATTRAALARAVHHARHRRAFGALLVDQPLMRSVLTDLALESEAATLLGMRLAHAVDTGEVELARLGVAVGKYWVCKRTPTLVAEALECLGGAGYVEENGLARLYRQAPLNSIWEGSGNVNALDVVRAISREPASLKALLEEAAVARGTSSTLDRALDAVETACAAVALDPLAAQAGARRLVEDLALVLQGSLMTRYAPPELAEAFVESRLGAGARLGLGSIDPGLASLAAPVALGRC
ncbi:DNA alkylation response protein [Janibacter melonis]|uniref:DNA alkylation response protein n=1 Tax=Janibacter melonis TaxID=262209 RepID=A0A5P8FM90_9MICO|nr:acyl-CoA dehydrogenase family protein [Janibacter melonis]QFQ30293.2 DNA alkylation response protein [Janibacter melonis]